MTEIKPITDDKNKQRSGIVPYQLVADLLKVSQRTISRWVNTNGAPAEGKGKVEFARFMVWLYFHQKDIIEKLRQGDETYQEASRRLIQANANLKEIQLKKLAGEILIAPDVKRILERFITAWKTKIFLIPNKCSPQIISLQSIPEIKSILENEIKNAFDELSKSNISFSEKQSADFDMAEPELLGSQNADRKRMGRGKSNSVKRIRKRSRAVSNEPSAIPKEDAGHNNAGGS